MFSLHHFIISCISNRKGGNSMQGVNVFSLVIVIAYLVGMLLVGFIVGKLQIKDSKDYMIAGRRMGLFMVACSLSANNIGGGSTTGLAGKAYGTWGMSAMWYVLAASVAMIPLAYFAPKIRKTMSITIPEVISRRFGTASGTFSAVLNILALFCLTSSQIMASGSVVNVLTGIPLNVCIFIAAAVIIVYTTMGGMIADQITDLIQFLVILFGLAIATPFVLNGCGGWAAISAKLPAAKLDPTSIGWTVIIGYIFNYFCTFLSGPEMVSRFESCKDEKTAVGASLVSAVLMAAMAIFPTLMGLAAFSIKDTLPATMKANAAMMTVTQMHAPAVITGVVSASIIAATMSSADSNLLCMSTIFINDLYLKFRDKSKAALTEKQIIHSVRLCNVIAAVVATLIALGNVDIVTMNTFAFAIRCAGPFAAYGLGLVVKKAIPQSGIISIVTGTIGVVAWQILGKGDFYMGILPVVFGCAIGTLTFFIVNWIGWGMHIAPAPSAYPDEK